MTKPATPTDDDDRILKDGEKISVGFLFRDDANGATSPPSCRRDSAPAHSFTFGAGAHLRCLDTGRTRTLDGALIAAIKAEAARVGLSAADYLRDRLKYEVKD